MFICFILQYLSDLSDITSDMIKEVIPKQKNNDINIAKTRVSYTKGLSP